MRLAITTGVLCLVFRDFKTRCEGKVRTDPFVGGLRARSFLIACVRGLTDANQRDAQGSPRGRRQAMQPRVLWGADRLMHGVVRLAA